jgi:4-phosphopantoate--beta-alanine ligase
VIAIDLNPLSRTARKATVSIVDNILRVVPNLTKQILLLSKVPRSDSDRVVQKYDNERVLREAVQEMQDHLTAQFQGGKF